MGLRLEQCPACQAGTGWCVPVSSCDFHLEYGFFYMYCYTRYISWHLARLRPCSGRGKRGDDYPPLPLYSTRSPLYQRGEKKPAHFSPCACVLLASQSTCTPCSIFLGADRCRSSQEPTAWVLELCPHVPDKGGDFREMEMESQATGNQNSMLATEEAKQRAKVSALA